MLGEMVDAREAQRLGLVNRVVAPEQVLAEAESLARKLAALSPRTVRMNKLLVNRVHELAGFHQALNYRDDPLVQALTSATADADEVDQHLKVLREQGWEAFRQSRDVLYRSER